MNRQLLKWTGIPAALAMLMIASGAAWAEEFEWNPREGLHEEEWYDPGDWFDYETGAIDYDYDWWDYGYGYNYYPYDYGYYPYGYDYDYYDWDYDYDWDWYDEQQTTGWHPGQRSNIYGTIERLKIVRLDRFGEAQLAAEVETDDGRWRRTLLGPIARLRNLDIEEGDEINVIGPVHRVQGIPTLVATQFSTDFDPWVHIGRERTQRQDQRQNARQRQDERRRPVKWYHGEVRDTKVVKFKGIEERQVLAKVRLDDGNMVPVNLGPVGDLPRQLLEKGDRVALTARRGRINGDVALVAQMLRLDGEQMRIDREAERLRFQRMQKQKDKQQRQNRQDGQASARDQRRQ